MSYIMVLNISLAGLTEINIINIGVYDICIKQGVRKVTVHLHTYQHKCFNIEYMR